MAKLFSLLAITAGTYGPSQQAIPEAQVFEGPGEGEIFDKLIADGAARVATDAEVAAYVENGLHTQGGGQSTESKTSAAPDAGKTRGKASPVASAASKTVRVRLLVACPYGSPNDVVTLPADEVKQAVTDGIADDTKAAVEYAAKLPQNLVA